jgi:DNA-binding NtrC family response regulator
MMKHILSVDDEANIRELLKEVLTMKGYRVSTAAEPSRAKQIVEDDPPQLIIMDFQIEEGDGFALIEKFKKFVPATPILLLTGVIFDQQVVRDTIEKKVDSYLDKTASLKRIVLEIQRLLGDRRDDPRLPLNLRTPRFLEDTASFG